MSKLSLNDELNQAVEILMTDADAPLPAVHPRLAAVLRIAGELRDLPSDLFKAQLKAALLSAAYSSGAAEPVPIYGKALLTMEDIAARLDELSRAPQLVAYDLHAALTDMPEHSMRFFASLNRCTLGVSHFSTQSPAWERHPAGDELLHVLEGELEVTTLTDDGPVQTTVRAGSVFICPKGLWHWPRPQPYAAIFFATPGEGIEHAAQPPSSGAPRRRPGSSRTKGRPAAPPVRLAAHDLQAALRRSPALVITERTTGAEADAAFRHFSALDECQLGVGRFTGLTPWERHPDGDELLMAIEGGVDIEVATDQGVVHRSVRAGEVFVCPRGVWHRQHADTMAAMLYGTPTATTEISFADDPLEEGW